MMHEQNIVEEYEQQPDTVDQNEMPPATNVQGNIEMMSERTDFENPASHPLTQRTSDNISRADETFEETKSSQMSEFIPKTEEEI